MDLKNFVAETLTQIVAGVADAQTRVKEIDPNARINPTWVGQSGDQQHGDAAPVEFDVALVVSEESTEANSGKAGGSVGILSVVTARLSSEIQNQTTGAQKAETISRIKFSVLLAQPADLKTLPKIDYGSRNHYA